MKRISILLLPVILFSSCLFLMRQAHADQSIHQISVQGIMRRYILHIPASYSKGIKTPLVIVLHGGGGNGRNAEKMSKFSEKADSEGFLVLYPFGTNRLFDEKLLTWNAGNCCGYAHEQKVDDVEFIRQLILLVKNQYAVGPIYVTGMSNGGMMSYRIGCELAGLIDGIAPVSGAMNTESCNPDRPLDVIIFHGRADKHILYNGGAPEVQVDRNPRIDRSVSFAENFWKEKNGCSGRRVERAGKVERITYSCKKARLSVISIDDEGHTWPGGAKGFFGADEPTEQISATDTMWKFWK